MYGGGWHLLQGIASQRNSCNYGNHASHYLPVLAIILAVLSAATEALLKDISLYTLSRNNT